MLSQAVFPFHVTMILFLQRRLFCLRRLKACLISSSAKPFLNQFRVDYQSNQIQLEYQYLEQFPELHNPVTGLVGTLIAKTSLPFRLLSNSYDCQRSTNGSRDQRLYVLSETRRKLVIKDHPSTDHSWQARLNLENRLVQLLLFNHELLIVIYQESTTILAREEAGRSLKATLLTLKVYNSFKIPIRRY